MRMRLAVVGRILPVLSALYCLGPASAAPPTETAGAAARPVAADAAGSYSVGLSFATQWREGGLTPAVSEADLLRGIQDGLAGKALSAEDRTRAATFLHSAYEAYAARNDAAATAFLAKNAKVAGVKTTASGLQYEVLATGDANATHAGANDRVKVQYRGKLLDGTEFDSSYARGQPAVIRPSAVIAGWREALGMMNPGAKWRVYIPPALAYGSSPPPQLPPNALLTFDIELLSIEAVGGAQP